MNKQIPEIKQIFKDLEDYQNFCRYEGKVYDEAHLYLDGNKNWEDYKRYQNYIRSKKKSSKSVRK